MWSTTWRARRQSWLHTTLESSRRSGGSDAMARDWSAARRRCKLRRMFGLVTRVKAVRRRTQTLFELNLELAKLEAKKKAVAAGIAGGFAAVGAVLAVYAIGFLFAAAAAGLS